MILAFLRRLFPNVPKKSQTIGTKILPINAVDEIYILAKVFTYTMAFLADNNIMLHIFSPYQSFRGNFFPNTSNSVNKSGFVLLNQVRAFDDKIK